MTKDGLFTPHSTWEAEARARAATMAEDQKTIERLRARVEGYKALWIAASNALHKLDQSSFSNAEHEQAKAYLRAALQQEGETNG